MKFYTKQHKFYCGIDIHARMMYACILDKEGNVVLHKNMKAGPDFFPRAIADFRKDLVVAVECIFTWYWLADLCTKEGLPFVLAHTLYMKEPNYTGSWSSGTDQLQLFLLRTRLN